jgi:multicomponent Na+:H+ antiporter subunit E
VATALVSFATWVLLTWTLSVQFMVYGVVIAVAVTVALAPVMRDTGTIRITPRRVLGVLALFAGSVRGIVAANLGLARRIWSPSLPLRSGMVEVPTRVRSEAGLGAVGIITSLIVDNQIVDVDRERHALLYHAIDVPDQEAAYGAVNGPVDAPIAALEGQRDK